MNPSESSSSDPRRKWMWVLALTSPIDLTLIGYVLFQAVPPDDLLLRNLVILLLIVLGFGVLFVISRLAAGEANKNIEYFNRQIELTNRIAPGAFTPESLQMMRFFQPPQRSRRSMILRLATAVLVWSALYWLVTQARPAWSSALNGITGLVVGLLVFLVWDLVEGILRNARKNERPIPWHIVVAILAGAPVIGLGGILLATALESWAKRPEALPIFLLLGTAVFALVFLPMGWDVLVGEYVRRPLRQSLLINRLFMRNSVGELRANHAWALASAGRYQEARETLERAFKEYDKSSRLSAASIHWRAGQVMHLRGDLRAAREQFSRALEIDPNGNYGRLARQMLATT